MARHGGFGLAVGVEHRERAVRVARTDGALEPVLLFVVVIVVVVIGCCSC